MLGFVVSLLLTGEPGKAPIVGPAFWSGASAVVDGSGVSGAPTIQNQERIVEIRVQGNYRTPEADILRLAAIQIGDAITPETLAALQTRLEQSGKFDEVEIRKRWRTIDSTEDVVLVIVVREEPGGSSNPIGRLARSLTHPLVLPIFYYTDGYGLTYGGRFSPVNLLGPNTHVSIPLSWGATKQAALELDRPFATGPLTRMTAGVSLRERPNPFYDADDLRLTVSARAERTLFPLLRVGLSGALSDVTFTADDEEDEGDDSQLVPAHDERLAVWGADAAFDTRKNTELPRNAVLVQASWDRLQLDEGAIDRYEVDTRGYLGLIGGSVLVLRAARADASRALPQYEQFLIGGFSSLRGFRAGYDAGDTLVLGSAELRIPLTSPVSFGRVGATLFVDTGAVHAAEERLHDVRFRTGVGAGLFFNAAIFNLNLDVARGLDRGWRVHVATGVQF